jgi:mannose-6-phosphate isomerase
VNLSPARLEPVFSPRPWGSLSLAPHFPEQSSLAERIGEAWMTGNDSRFANGPFAGQTLSEAWRQMSPQWAGSASDTKHDFPLLIKFLFTEAKLSVQVHPGDDHAARFEPELGGRGKTEMWYALRAEPGAEVMVGLKPEITADEFRSCIENSTAENCLTRLPVQAGDTIFVPAGSAHTIGPGLLLCEIQQHSDITYRVYDYNRPDASGKLRDLHIEKAMKVMRFGPQKGGKLEPVRVPSRGGLTEMLLAACPYFVTIKWAFEDAQERETSPLHFDVLVFLEGHGQIYWNGEQMAYRPTEVWLLPARLGKYQLEPASRTALLRTYVPKDLKEFAADLTSRGVNRYELVRVTHP